MDSADKIESYHVHVYYDESTRQEAAHLRDAIESAFEVTMGRWRDEPVGPHPTSMYQVAFEVAEFPKLVPWLMLNRGTLDVLIHPNTGEEVEDHRDRALWLGEKLALNIGFLEDFMKKQAAEQAAKAAAGDQGG